ncbi:type 1 secretion C-target domain protein, partial [Vibrio parahaemolyticus EKP-028]|jgi:DHA1 family multidrug resistance protein-like MFS transporter
LPST